MSWKKRLVAYFLVFIMFFGQRIPVFAQVDITSASAILMEASTGQIILEKNARERRSPASITKIMTILLTFEALKEGRIKLADQVLTSNHASSMGGSQVFLAEGELQTLDTMLKCIIVSSGNDASVAVGEHIAGSEEAFVDMMNKRAEELGMTDTHFEDCCGLTESDNHYTTAHDVAIMSRELTTKHPEVFQYTTIWMEDITHETRQGTSNFTLSSTNKLLKQYQWATGLKTGSTSKAKYCVSATASKDGIDLIAVVLGAPDTKSRFGEAKALLSYGFSNCRLYIDKNEDTLPALPVEGGLEKEIPLRYAGEFRYLDTAGSNFEELEKRLNLPEKAAAPIKEGEQAGFAGFYLNGVEIGRTMILYGQDMEKARLLDFLKKAIDFFLL